MVSECAFGLFKGRWRILCRKCESKKESVVTISLACVVLHNICIDPGDVSWRKWDVNVDPASNGRRPMEVVRKLLNMRQCPRVRDRIGEASKIRDTLKGKFWNEMLGFEVQ